MTGVEITQGERARWQRRAAAELGQILRAHPGLPCISWTVGPSGPVLGALFGGGVALGWLGAWISAQRHLRSIEPRA